MNERLDALKEQMLACGSCDLCTARTQVVFGSGSTNPLLMLVGEAPGEEEDKQGVPFVGAAGEKLNKILSFIGVDRDEIYITNSVLCRPPNNRNPRQEELEACRFRLDLQIQLLRPRLVVLLGKVALQQLTGKPVKGALRNYFIDKVGWQTYKTGDHSTQVLVTYHPSYLLRAPEKGYRAVLPHWTKVKEWVDRERKTAQR